jgi:hypothetical protein
MPVDSQGRWYPDLYPRQVETLEACVPSTQNFVLLNGPRWASKTFACHHAICQHAWNTDRGNVCLITVTMGVGVDSGVWQHLTEIFIPEWISGDFGMEWVREPYIQNITKKPCCEVSNKFGNKTRISLESLRNEDEVEARFKGKGYSMIWVNELSKFKQRKTFDTLKQQLRMPHLAAEQHLFLADTNPDLELGAQSWIYQLWYEFRTADVEILQRMFPTVAPDALMPLQKALRLIEYSVDDNLSLSTEKKQQLMADFAHDDDLLAAYFYGKWVTASADALFFKVFRPRFHVVGELETASNPDPEVLAPKEGAYELILGIDPGATNCAAAILEKTYEVIEPQKDPKAPPPKAVPVIKVLDELVVIGQDFDLVEYIEELTRKMEYWEEVMEKPGKVIWRQWSDRSAFDMKVPFSDRFWHQHIYAASGGKITLMAAERGKGSVQARIDLFRKLLYENRIFFSKTNCPSIIEMCKSIKKGTRVGELIARGSQHKHAFDAATYAIASELYDELSTESWDIMRNLRKMKQGKNEASLVTVPL